MGRPRAVGDYVTPDTLAIRKPVISVDNTSDEMPVVTTVLRKYRVALNTHRRIRGEIARTLRRIENDEISAEKGRTLLYGLSTAIGALKAQQAQDLAVANFLAGLSETQLLGIQQLMGSEELTPHPSQRDNPGVEEQPS